MNDTNTNAPLGERKKESFRIFDDIAQTYDSLNKVLSFGIDIYWRRQIRKNLPQNAEIEVLDLATGTADVPIELIKAPNVNKILGLDLSQGMIDVGNVKIDKKKLTEKITLGIGDGCNLPLEKETWDVTTVSFGIRNFPDCFKGLQEMHRVLKPGGRAMIMEFSLPASWPVRMIYLLYFRYVLPFVGNLFSGHGDAYSYLNKTVEDFPYGEEFLELMRKAGFTKVSARPLTFGIATLYIGDK
jgi:demethylmenaquinone methyltransferase/2-methoxy-6-polyprenyl-1,4-benzoquinol methylase